MTKDDVIKIIDGIPFYNYDYIGFLYNKLQEKDKKIEQLTNNWNELEEWVKQRIDKVKYNSYDDVLDKMKEIKEGNDEFIR